jgi:DNA-binding SARP family transcriptional activator
MRAGGTPLPPLKLFLLGSPRVERDGKPVEADTRKAVALLAYLALSGQSQSRDALAALFWPEVDGARAHAALRRTLSALNKAAGGQGLLIDRETVGLDRAAGVWVDVDQFRARLAGCHAHGHPAPEVCAACLSPLAEAAALYRGDFLSGFTLRDSPAFDDWQFFQSETLRRELAGALERLVRCHAARREYEPAIAHARRWLALDPLHEPAHRQLMQLYAQSGQHAAALRQYRECVRILEEELSVPPLEETTRLYESIKEQRSMGVREHGGVEAPSPTRPHTHTPALPLVGRSTEWAALLGEFASIKTDGRLVVLEGEAGIGKTRLAEAFLQQARSAGAAALVARCYEGEMNLAYGSFVEALRGALAQPEFAARLNGLPAHHLGEASRLLPELASLHPGPPLPSPVEGPGAQTRFFEAISQCLLALCGGPPPGLLLLDDLHWADEASLDLLTYLVRRLRGRPLCLLITWRGEQVPAHHRLRALLAEAQRAGAGTLLPLSRLGLAEVTELVRSAVGGQPPTVISEFVERLYRETEGLPFFLVEYLAAMPRSAEEWPLPVGVRGLLQSRLNRVSETGQQLLSAAAVIGRSFDFDTLREASGRSEDETVTALEDLMGRGLVAEVQGGDGAITYDFSHEKLRALVYAETSLARRRLLHRRVAEALTRRARTPTRPHPHTPSAALIAQHYQLAGESAEAAHYFKLAGEHARTLYANAEALAHFRAALALGHPEPAALHEAIGDLQTLSGDYGAALASYETAAALCAPESLAGLEHKLGNVHHRRGDWELAESHFQSALNALDEMTDLAGLGRPARSEAAGERARLHADWSLTAHHRGQTDHALALARRALELAEAAGDRRARAQAHNILGVLASSQNDSAQARHHLEQSLALAEALDDLGARVAALNNLALAFRHGGETAPAIALTENALALCASQGDRHREAALHNNLADLLHAAGRPDEAMTHLKRAVALFAEIGAQAGDMQPEIWKLTEW